MQVLFEHHGKGIVSRDTFEWNKNDFSRLFKCTSDATEFVEKFQALTFFDTVQQIVLTKAVGDREILHSQTLPANENQREENEPETSAEDNPPPAKKQKKTHTFEMGKAVDAKKVGKQDLFCGGVRVGRVTEPCYDMSIV